MSREVFNLIVSLLMIVAVVVAAKFSKAKPDELLTVCLVCAGAIASAYLIASIVDFSKTLPSDEKLSPSLEYQYRGRR